MTSKSLFSKILLAGILLSSSCELVDDVILSDAGRLTGYWSVSEQSELYKSTLTYEVYISPDADNENGVVIDNFYDLGDNIFIRASVSGTTLSLGNKTNDNEFTISGSGTISANSRTINLSYNADDGSGVADHCVTVYTKK
jgi:hypothetical protein